MMVNSPDVKYRKAKPFCTLLLLNVQSAVMLNSVSVADELNCAQEAGSPQAAIDVGLVSRAGTCAWLAIGKAKSTIRNKQQRRNFLVGRCGGGGV